MKIPRFLQKLVSAWIVSDVPPDIYACELCHETHCSAEKLARCTFRQRCEKELVEGTQPDGTARVDTRLAETEEAPTSTPADSELRSKSHLTEAKSADSA